MKAGHLQEKGSDGSMVSVEGLPLIWVGGHLQQNGNDGYRCPYGAGEGGGTETWEFMLYGFCEVERDTSAERL